MRNVSYQEPPVLGREQLASLIPICPLIMDWLRSRTIHTADLFQLSFAEDYDSVAVALDALSRQLEVSINIPFTSLANILSSFSCSVWANALRLVLTQSQPKIVPAEIGTDIVGCIPRLNSACTVTEVCHILGPLLDKLPRNHFSALGEFCALLRDTGTNATLLACLVGPQLLLPNLMINSPKKQGHAALAAAAVMELLIAESESLFGRCASNRIFLPFGEFNEYGGTRNREDASVNFKAAAQDPENIVAKASLRAFYDWRDPMKSPKTESLFKTLSLMRIGQGLQEKYGLIPPGWGLIIGEIMSRQSSRPRLDTNLSSKTRDGAANLLPAEMSADYEKFRQAVKQEKKENNVSGFEESEKLLRVIQEMCQSETKYYYLLNTFTQTYCQKLQDIISGKDRESDLDSLGLTSAEVNAMFGNLLVKCKDTAAKFVASLGILTDFQGAANLDGRGNLGVLINSFREVFSHLDVLGPYMSTYSHVLRTLNEKTSEVRRGKKKKSKKKKGLNFLQLWELERVKHDNLKLSSIENVLIKPVQRIPHYKTLLKELLKIAEKDGHPAVQEVKDLLADVEALGQRIDRNVTGANNKAAKLLGF